jgi:hypothetical protein
VSEYKVSGTALVAVLEAPGRGAVAEVQKILAASGALAPLTLRLGPAVGGVTVAIAHRAVAFLHSDVGGIVMAGWKLHRRIQEAATATLRGDGPAQYVTLSDHEVAWESRPQVQVVVDNDPPYLIELLIRVTIRIGAVALEIQRGCLVGAGPGFCVARLSLGIGSASATYEKELRARSLAQFQDLPLLPASAYAANPVRGRRRP